MPTFFDKLLAPAELFSFVRACDNNLFLHLRIDILPSKMIKDHILEVLTITRTILNFYKFPISGVWSKNKCEFEALNLTNQWEKKLGIRFFSCVLGLKGISLLKLATCFWQRSPFYWVCLYSLHISITSGLIGFV